MLNYFVDSYMWCFFLSQCWKCREFLCKCEQRQGQGTKEKDKLYLFEPYCFLSTKQNSSSLLPSSKPEFALVALPLLPGTSSVVSRDVTLSQLLLWLSYVFPPKVRTSSRQLFLILVHKSAVSLIFKGQGPIDQNFGKISDLKCLVLNPRKQEIH